MALLTPHPPSREGYGGRILDSEMCIHRYVENPTSQSNRGSLTEMWWMNKIISLKSVSLDLITKVVVEKKMYLTKSSNKRELKVKCAKTTGK